MINTMNCRYGMGSGAVPVWTVTANYAAILTDSRCMAIHTLKTEGVV
ncbi:MAG: hypothetical protein HFI89_11835 [Lachnospiraceae bacterium]|nr:hypothetical protein [Lachnospiraceae bacterium]